MLDMPQEADVMHSHIIIIIIIAQGLPHFLSSLTSNPTPKA